MMRDMHITRFMRALKPGLRFPEGILTAVVIFLFAFPAYGTYFMYRGKPPKFSVPARMELFARSPQLNRPFEYRKIYMPRMVTPVSARAKSLPQFDLRPRPQSIYELRLEEFIAECERLISEDRRGIDTRPGDFMLFSSIPWDKAPDLNAKTSSPPLLIAVARGSSWEPSGHAASTTSRLAGAAAAALGRDIRSVGAVPLDTSDLAGIRLLILSSGSSDEPSRTERDALAEYLRAGGFIYLDNDQNGYTLRGFNSAVNRYAAEQPGLNIVIAPLQTDHPLYSALAASGKSIPVSSTVTLPFAIRCNGRFAGIVGDSTLMLRWSYISENSDILKLWIDLISYVLSHEVPAESTLTRDKR